MIPAVVRTVIDRTEDQADVTAASQNARAREWPGHRSAAVRRGRSFAGISGRRGQDRILTSSPAFECSALLSAAGSSLASVAWLAALSSAVGGA